MVVPMGCNTSHFQEIAGIPAINPMILLTHTMGYFSLLFDKTGILKN
jgi:hypothetical protein